MSVIEATVLGLVQGATEFLPVSSSGHLTLAEMAMGVVTDDLVALDVALHGATLLAVLAYFGRGWLRRVARGPRVAVLAVAAGVPAGVLYLAGGGALERAVGGVKTSLWALGALFIAAGGFLAFASILSARLHPNAGDTDGPIVPRGRRGVLDVAVIGLAQAAALLPGVSRSGVTIGTGLLCGLTRESAFEFSFLAATPLLVGALAVKMSKIGELAAASGAALAAGSVVAFASGFAALALLRRVVARGRLWAFGLYTVVAGLGCFAWAMGSAA
jgi:undecaprenyl-diphosphatase